MGVLDHHRQGAAEVRLSNLPQVQAVVGDGPPVDLVEPGDEVDDGGLSCPGGTHEGDFLAGLGVEAHISQHRFLRHVAEADVLEPHIPPEGRQGPVGPLPGKGAVRCLPPGAVRPRLSPDQGDLPLVHLRLLVHHPKDPLGSREGGEEEVCLLGQLVHGHGTLADIDQIGGETGNVGEAGEDEEPSHAGGDGVVEVAEAYHRGDHYPRIAHRPGARPAQGLILFAEGLVVRRLVVEDLLHLLPRHHLLHKAVEVRQARLLLVEILLAAAAAIEDKEEHQNQEKEDDEGQLGVQHQQHGDGARHHNEALDEKGEAVVQGLADGVHVIGEVTHQFPVGVAVKVLEGQGLGVEEQVPADLGHYLLGGADHQLIVPQGAQGPHAVHGRHLQHHPPQARYVSGLDEVPDYRPQKVGTEDVGHAAENHHHRHRRQGQLVSA